ncbi:hypothetical protein H9P43_004008 [Blastocladiella emersonii ATCC 22665]|nr:hypothetical protein H9P43_004008 [Blastocladiella emersonii ATCC 22665]
MNQNLLHSDLGANTDDLALSGGVADEFEFEFEFEFSLLPSELLITVLQVADPRDEVSTATREFHDIVSEWGVKRVWNRRRLTPWLRSVLDDDELRWTHPDELPETDLGGYLYHSKDYSTKRPNRNFFLAASNVFLDIMQPLRASWASNPDKLLALVSRPTNELGKPTPPAAPKSGASTGSGAIASAIHTTATAPTAANATAANAGAANLNHGGGNNGDDLSEHSDSDEETDSDFDDEDDDEYDSEFSDAYYDDSEEPYVDGSEPEYDDLDYFEDRAYHRKPPRIPSCTESPVYCQLRLLYWTSTQCDATSARWALEATVEWAPELLEIKSTEWFFTHPSNVGSSISHFCATPEPMRFVDYLALLAVYSWKPGFLEGVTDLGIALDVPCMLRLGLGHYLPSAVLNHHFPKKSEAAADVTRTLDWLMQSAEPLANMLLAANLLSHLMKPHMHEVLSHALTRYSKKLLSSAKPEQRAELAVLVRQNVVGGIGASDVLSVFEADQLLDTDTLGFLLTRVLNRSADLVLPGFKDEVLSRIGSQLATVVEHAFYACLMHHSPGMANARRLFEFAQEELPSELPMLTGRFAAIIHAGRDPNSFKTQPLADPGRRFASVFAGLTIADKIAPLFDLMVAVLNRAKEADCEGYTCAHWLVVGGFQHPATRARALAQVAGNASLARKLLGIMVAAQFDASGCKLRAVLEYTSAIDGVAARTCNQCTLSGQSPWFATLRDLLGARGVGLAQLPEFSKTAIRRLFELSTRLDQPFNKTSGGSRSKKAQAQAQAAMPAACRAHHVQFPVRELVRVLIGADLGALLSTISKKGCPVMADFWRQVPDGALDAVRDAAWIKRSVNKFKQSGRSECVAEFKRVAPVGWSAYESARS